MWLSWPSARSDRGHRRAMVRALCAVSKSQLCVSSRYVSEVWGTGDRRRRRAGQLPEGAVALLGVRRGGRGLPRLAPPPGPLAAGDLTPRPSSGRDPSRRVGGRVSDRRGLWRSLVSASVWGTEGRRFESSQPDHQTPLGRPFWPSCWSRRNVGAVEPRELDKPSVASLVLLLFAFACALIPMAAEGPASFFYAFLFFYATSGVCMVLGLWRVAKNPRLRGKGFAIATALFGNPMAIYVLGVALYGTLGELNGGCC